jgi:class 3 adenylate cyclase
MPFPRVIPALADLTQEIAGPVPVALLQDWARGKQDLESARALLEPFAIRGTIVASDASGLSRMTREMELLEVLHVVSRPKQIVHAVGRAIGGRAVGRWLADNTEMYYPASVGADAVLAALTETQARIAASARVRVGMCLHPGEFYEIGGTLYGRDAHAVESLAEHHAGPDEILVTGEAIAGLARPSAFRFRLREDLASRHPGGVFGLIAGPRMPDLVATDVRYPHGYTEEFFRFLLDLDPRPDPRAVREKLYGTYQRERVIAFVVRDRPSREGDDLAAMLDELVVDALLDTVVGETVGRDHVAQSGGGLAVLAFAASREALAAALELRERFAQNGIAARIGIDRGPVLFFENRDGPKGVAGDPINTASKISEDAGRAGKISLTTRVTAELGPLPGGEPFQVTVSDVRLTGIVL